MKMTRGLFQARAAYARAHKLAPKRLPRQAEPLAVKGRYARRIKARVLEDAMRLVREKLVPHLEELAANSSGIGAPVADAMNDRELADIMEEISAEYFGKWSRKEFGKVVRPVADEVANFQAGQLNKQLSAAIGERISLDIVGDEPWLQAAVDDFVRENVALIKSIPEQFFSELEKNLSRDIADGARWEDLAQEIQDRYDVSESRAELIARDQVGKFNGDLNKERQTALGVESFIWRTVGDERVRTDETAGDDLGHAERNGVTYSWADPPEGEIPGSPISCRCYSEPVIEGLLEE